jgi:hypothetical protein
MAGRQKAAPQQQALFVAFQSKMRQTNRAVHDSQIVQRIWQLIVVWIIGYQTLPPYNQGTFVHSASPIIVADAH